MRITRSMYYRRRKGSKIAKSLSKVKLLQVCAVTHSGLALNTVLNIWSLSESVVSQNMFFHLLRNIGRQIRRIEANDKLLRQSSSSLLSQKMSAGDCFVNRSNPRSRCPPLK